MTDDGSQRSWKKTGRRAIVVLIVLATGLGVWSVLLRGPRPTPMPRPNGYDDLTRAATLIVGTLPGKGSWREAGIDELRAFVDSNREALAMIRKGLGRTIRVPLSGPQQKQIEASIASARQIRSLAQLLAIEGQVALNEGRRDDATRAGVDLVRLGHEASRGGLAIDHQIGQFASREGIDLLSKVRTDLSPTASRALVRDLEAIDLGREPVAEVFHREHALASASGLVMQLNLTFNPALKKLTNSSKRAIEFSDKRTVARLRLLMTELAVSGYRQRHGVDPERLDDLVPVFLAGVPIDPFRGQPLVYRKLPSGSLVYTVGPDGKDDGGSPKASRRIPVGQITSTSVGDYTLDDQ
jgi:hypothetical protein